MRSLPKSTLDPGEVYRDCISSVSDDGLKRRLEEIADIIVTASDDYDLLAAASQLHLEPISIGVNGTVSKDEMIGVYGRMVNGPGRKHYDELFQSSPDSKCPLCGHRNVKTLDHVLPKARFSKHTVTPLNLVPACSDCNKSKRTQTATTPENEPLHPYYDNIEGIPWLSATVQETRPATTSFFVSTPEDLDATLAARIANHFDSLDLAELYTIEASDELTGIRYELATLLERAGSDAVAAHLTERANSMQRGHLNWWRTAAYKAWASSAWFCEGGFAEQG